MGSILQAGAHFVALALMVAPLTGCGEERPALPTGPTGARQEPPPTVTAVAPTVTAVAPNRGPVGSTVRITGTGFSPGAKIVMGDAATNVVVFNSTLIEATAPLGARGTVDVIVLNPNGQRAVLADAYTYEIKPAHPPALTFVWVVVLEGGGSGLCIPGATVEIVRGQGLGRRLTQSTLGCDYWDPDYDAIFDGLNVGEELTLRASASGYAAKETTVVPTLGGQTAVSIVLSKIQ